MRSTKNISQIIGMGILAGIRTSFTPAFLSHHYHKHHNKAVADSKAAFIQSAQAAAITKFFAGFEIVGDKNPLAPNRTGFPQVFFRIASGAFAGAVLAKAEKQNAIAGFVIGAVAATAGTFGAFYLRRYISRLPGVEDVYVGAAEDILGLGMGAALLKRYHIPARHK